MYNRDCRCAIKHSPKIPQPQLYVLHHQQRHQKKWKIMRALYKYDYHYELTKKVEELFITAVDEYDGHHSQICCEDDDYNEWGKRFDKGELSFLLLVMAPILRITRFCLKTEKVSLKKYHSFSDVYFVFPSSQSLFFIMGMRCSQTDAYF